MKKIFNIIIGLLFVQLAFGQVDRFRGDVIIDGELTVSNSIIATDQVDIITSSQILNGDSVNIIDGTNYILRSLSIELVFGTTPYTTNTTDTVKVRTISGTDTINLVYLEPSFLELASDRWTDIYIDVPETNAEIYWIEFPSGVFSVGDSGLIVYSEIKRRN